MGWAAKYGKRYRAMYRDSSGKMCSAGIHDRRRDAEDAANEAEAIARGAKKSVPTWSEWKDEWWQLRVIDDSTRQRDESAIRKHVEPRWGDVLLPDITRRDVQLWVNELAEELAPATVAKTFRILSGSMAVAHSEGIIPSNPCQTRTKTLREGVILPKPNPLPDRFLTDAECEALRAFIEDEWQIMFDILLGTGMRLGEAFALHWEDVDLRNGVVTVFWSFDHVGRRIKAPKDRKPRSIPIGEDLRKLLADRLERLGSGTPPDVIYVGSRTTHTGLVVGSLNDRGWQYAWRAARRFATVDGRKVGQVRTHDLRHTYASRRAQDNIDMFTLGRLLGHSNYKTTERYARVGNTRWDDVRRSLNG